MLNRIRLGYFAVMLLGFTVATRAAQTPAVDCNCVAILPALHTTCPGILPDIGLLATNCFSTNVNLNALGFYSQVPFPNTWLPFGTNTIQFSVTDSNYNTTTCTVDFVVSAP